MVWLSDLAAISRFFSDGSFLAVGSHDNFIYIYSVSESGRRYTRFGKCTVSVDLRGRRPVWSNETSEWLIVRDNDMLLQCVITTRPFGVI